MATKNLLVDWENFDGTADLLTHRKEFTEFLGKIISEDIQMMVNAIESNNLSNKLQNAIKAYIQRFTDYCIQKFVTSIPPEYRSLKKVEHLIKLLRVPFSSDPVLINQQIINYINLMSYERDICIYPLLDTAFYHKKTNSLDLLKKLAPNCAEGLGISMNEIESRLSNIDDLILYLQGYLPSHLYINTDVNLNQKTGDEMEYYGLLFYKLIGDMPLDECITVKVTWDLLHESLKSNIILLLQSFPSMTHDFYTVVCSNLEYMVNESVENKRLRNHTPISIEFVQPFLNVLSEPENKIKYFGDFIIHLINIFKCGLLLGYKTVCWTPIGKIIQKAVTTLEIKQDIPKYLKSCIDDTTQNRKPQPTPDSVIQYLQSVRDYPISNKKLSPSPGIIQSLEASLRK